MKGHIFHSAYGERYMSVHQALQQRAGGNDINVGTLLVEVAQRLHCLWLILYLVYEYQCALVVLAHIGLEENARQQVVKSVVGCKQFDILFFLKIQVDIVVEIFGKHLDKSCLAHLAGTTQNQRLSLFFLCPFAEIIDCYSFEHI